MFPTWACRFGRLRLGAVHFRVRTLPRRFAHVRGIRRLFLPQVGMRGPVKHLFQEFENSLWNRRKDYQEVPQEKRVSHHSRLREIARGARQRGEFLPGELESLRKVLCELLSEESCAEWLGFNDLARPN